MSKNAIESMYLAVDLLAEEIGDGTFLIERENGQDYALISTSYLHALEQKARAYDALTADPEEMERKQREIRKKFPDLF